MRNPLRPFLSLSPLVITLAAGIACSAEDGTPGDGAAGAAGSASTIGGTGGTTGGAGPSTAGSSGRTTEHAAPTALGFQRLPLAGGEGQLDVPDFLQRKEFLLALGKLSAGQQGSPRESEINQR